MTSYLIQRGSAGESSNRISDFPKLFVTDSFWHDSAIVAQLPELRQKKDLFGAIIRIAPETAIIQWPNIIAVEVDCKSLCPTIVL